MRGFLNDLYKIWIGERPGQLAAALSYYGMFSFAPVIYLAFRIADLFIDQTATAQQLYEQIVKFLGPQAADLIGELLLAIVSTSQTGTVLFSLISFIALYFAASGLFYQLQFALNMVWRVPPPQKAQTAAVIRSRLFSFLMVISVGLLLILATLVNVFLAWSGALLEALFGFGLSQKLLTLAATWVLITGSFALLYRVLPDVKVKWLDVLPGAAAAAVLVMISGALAMQYFSLGRVGSAFEAAGAFSVLLMAVYYIADIFILGAVITRVYACRFGSKRPELGITSQSLELQEAH